jgi:hypothetical protein
MATHYRGERIEVLLREIAESQQHLDAFQELDLVNTDALARGYMTLALAKAKLTSLQGGNDDQEGKKSR